MDENIKVNFLLLLSLWMFLSALYVSAPTGGCVDCTQMLRHGFPFAWLMETRHTDPMRAAFSEWDVNWLGVLLDLPLFVVLAYYVARKLGGRNSRS